MSDIVAHLETVDMSITESPDYMKKFEPSEKQALSLKRKSSYDEVSLSEQIKRFRITSTPGELRLQKDLKELELSGLNGISLQYPDDSGSVILQFTEVIPYAPVLFRISVPRYYPHNHPNVFCLNEGFPCPFILPTGEIIHSKLREEWSAIGTIRTVIDILQSIRLLFHNTFHSEYINESRCLNSISNEMNEGKDSDAIYMAEVILPGEELE